MNIAFTCRVSVIENMSITNDYRFTIRIMCDVYEYYVLVNIDDASEDFKSSRKSDRSKNPYKLL